MDLKRKPTYRNRTSVRGGIDFQYEILDSESFQSKFIERVGNFTRG